MTRLIPSDNIRKEISTAIDQEWDAFASRHPRLAAAICRESVAGNIADDLLTDPGFENALRAADDAAAQVALVRDLARKMLEGFARRLARWF